MVFKILGKCVVLYVVLSVMLSVYWRFIKPPADWSHYKGEWALVTGSSYGIGAEFAKSFAKRGINVILLARSQEKLKGVQEEIEKEYPGISTHLLVADVLKDNWENVLDSVSHLNVTILVNNIGGNNLDGKLVFLHESNEERQSNLKKFNIEPLLKVLHKFLPKMLKMHKGRIINVSSFGVYYGYKLDIYPGLKSFVSAITDVINNEYELDNIRAETLDVGEVSTPAIANKPVDFLVCAPKTLTENALNLWGWSEKYTPCFTHFFIKTYAQVVPDSFRRLSLRSYISEFQHYVETGYNMK